MGGRRADQRATPDRGRADSGRLQVEVRYMAPSGRSSAPRTPYRPTGGSRRHHVQESTPTQEIPAAADLVPNVEAADRFAPNAQPADGATRATRGPRTRTIGLAALAGAIAIGALAIAFVASGGGTQQRLGAGGGDRRLIAPRGADRSRLRVDSARRRLQRPPRARRAGVDARRAWATPSRSPPSTARKLGPRDRERLDPDDRRDRRHRDEGRGDGGRLRPRGRRHASSSARPATTTARTRRPRSW